MIYLTKDGIKIRTNDTEDIAKFEAEGFTQLTNWQIFWQVIMLNSLLDWLLPITVASVVFEWVVDHNLWGFIVSAMVFSLVMELLAPLKIWD